MTRILAIDNNAPHLADLLTILKFADYDILGANDGEQGIQIAQVERPDLILCGIMMPPPDGYEILRALRKIPDTAAIPVVFIFDTQSAIRIRTGDKHMPDGFLKKPILLSTLKVKIDSLIKKGRTTLHL